MSRQSLRVPQPTCCGATAASVLHPASKCRHDWLEAGSEDARPYDNETVGLGACIRPRNKLKLASRRVLSVYGHQSPSPAIVGRSLVRRAPIITA